jgi:hypothetical protein
MGKHTLRQATELTSESNVYFFKLQFTLNTELGIAESIWCNHTIESTGLPASSLHFEGSGPKAVRSLVPATALSIPLSTSASLQSYPDLPDPSTLTWVDLNFYPLTFLTSNNKIANPRCTLVAIILDGFNL